jgi:hypothetical protein
MEENSVPVNERVLDVKLIQERLETLLVATANKLEREWPTRYEHVNSARIIFVVRIRIAINTYSAIMYLCADTPRDPLRNPRFVLAVAPLVRSLFEELITIIFLLHDIPKYIPYLFKTGYKERWLELDYALKYHPFDPNWVQYISDLRTQMAAAAAAYNLTPKEVADPDNTLGRWPQPPKMLTMLKKQHPTSKAIDFIEDVNSWMYRKLSGQTHLDMAGLTKRGIHFSRIEAERMFGDEWEAKLDQHLDYYRREQIFIMWTLLLSIASEIEAHFGYDLGERAKFIWRVLIEYSDISKDFYNNRYNELLS